MKFSFALIKKFAPGNYTKQDLVKGLNFHAFEAVDIGGDVLDISVTPNRFSDASSHAGIAREAAIIMGGVYKDPVAGALRFAHKDRGVFRVNVKNARSCARYQAAYVDGIHIGPSPRWLRDALEACGLRSINNVVDVMNYVMLEVGQPLHAFDADKVRGGLVVRNAKQGESIETIDGQRFALDPSVLVIADADAPLAIAGIKGGKASEVTAATTRLLIESASFRSAEIYATSRKLGLRTDASIRFSHALSAELAARGMKRALMLLQEVAQAQVHPPIDVYPKKQTKESILFDLKKIEAIIGVPVRKTAAVRLLTALGFTVRGKKLEVPLLRTDLEDIEDVAEEIIRFTGYEQLRAQPPHIALGAATAQELVTVKDQLRDLLTGVGYTETYNYSLVSERDCGLAPEMIRAAAGKPVRLANPMSAETAVLRDSLWQGLFKNLKENKRFFPDVRVFEIGHVFQQREASVSEETVLGIAIAAPNSVLELKGVADMLFRRLGMTDVSLVPLAHRCDLMRADEALQIEIDGRAIGYLGSLRDIAGAILEVDVEALLEEVDGEREYEPLAKYPAIVRDLSLLIDQSARVGEIIAFMQAADTALVEDVDLVDWYEDEKLGDGKKSITLRIVFRADDRTLTDADADREMAKLRSAIEDKFDAEIR
ncbi:phenylalanine--tRNA ligase subunit beta [Patescibacteria group bacterium]|nr:phenylalanine--tRNA ligase subunit beta [Patescibacteria group bacterium]